MGVYSHLRLEERELIAARLDVGWSLRRVAGELGRSHSTLVRELKRHSGSSGYVPATAHRKAQSRPCRPNKVSQDGWLRRYVKLGLDKRWSPEQIAGRMLLEARPYYACKDTILSWLREQEDPRLAQYHGRRQCKPRRAKRLPIKHLVPVHKRTHSRAERGHWEADLMVFRFDSKHTITTLVERKSRYCILLLNHGKYAQPTMDRIQKALSALPKSWIKSVTFDRGKEFAKHYQLPYKTYFCDPGSPGQKGTNENTNRRVRNFYPKNLKQQEIDSLTQEELDKLMNIMNHTPRKCLGYQTPDEAIRQTTAP